MRFTLLLAIWMSGLVSVAAQAQQAYPLAGVWRFVDVPGSGLNLDVRPDAIGLGLYTYDVAGRDEWSLATGVLREGVLEADLQSFSGGSCLGCPYRAPALIQPTRRLRIEFLSSTRGRLRIDGGTSRAIAYLPFGADYVSDYRVGDDPGAAEFGSHSLPDLRGRWAFGSESLGGFTERLLPAGIDFDQRVSEPDGAVQFESRRYRESFESPVLTTYSLRCAATRGALIAHCELSRTERNGVNQVRDVIADFELSDVAEARLAGFSRRRLSAPHNRPLRVFGFRLPAPIAVVPAIGIWANPGRPGSGFTLDRRAQRAAVGLFSYGTEGDSSWYLADAAIVNGIFSGQLLQFTGACLECAPRTPTTTGTTRSIRIEFLSPARALVSIDGAEAEPFVLQPFGMRYIPTVFSTDSAIPAFGPHYLPDFRGTRWIALEDRDPLAPGAPAAREFDYAVSLRLPESDQINFVLRQGSRRYIDAAGQSEERVLDCRNLRATIPTCEVSVLKTNAIGAESLQRLASAPLDHVVPNTFFAPFEGGGRYWAFRLPVPADPVP